MRARTGHCPIQTGYLRRLLSPSVPMLSPPAAIVEADNCSVFLVDSKRGQLWSVASESGREFRIPIDAGIAGAVATTGDTINIAGILKALMIADTFMLLTRL